MRSEFFFEFLQGRDTSRSDIGDTATDTFDGFFLHLVGPDQAFDIGINADSGSIGVLAEVGFEGGIEWIVMRPLAPFYCGWAGRTSMPLVRVRSLGSAMRVPSLRPITSVRVVLFTPRVMLCHSSLSLFRT